MTDLAALINKHHPKAVDCLDGHKGPVVITWFEELDDDRYHLLKLKRCGHCGIPMGDTYASDDERELYYKGQEPPQEDF